MTILFFRCLTVYAMLIFFLRLSGKRHISQLQPFELATTMLIADLAAAPISDTGAPLLSAVTPIACLILLQGVLSVLTAKNRRIRRFVCGTPAAIIKEGKLDVKKVNELLLSVDDIIKILRSGGTSDIKNIRYAVVETGGDTSIVNKNDDMIVTVIENGKFVTQNISDSTPSEEALKKLLKERNINSERDVFWAFVYNGETVIILKEKHNEAV